MHKPPIPLTIPASIATILAQSQSVDPSNAAAVSSDSTGFGTLALTKAAGNEALLAKIKAFMKAADLSLVTPSAESPSLLTGANLSISFAPTPIPSLDNSLLNCSALVQQLKLLRAEHRILAGNMASAADAVTDMYSEIEYREAPQRVEASARLFTLSKQRVTDAAKQANDIADQIKRIKTAQRNLEEAIRWEPRAVYDTSLHSAYVAEFDDETFNCLALDEVTEKEKELAVESVDQSHTILTKNKRSTVVASGSARLHQRSLIRGKESLEIQLSALFASAHSAAVAAGMATAGLIQLEQQGADDLRYLKTLKRNLDRLEKRAALTEANFTVRLQALLIEYTSTAQALELETAALATACRHYRLSPPTFTIAELIDPKDNDELVLAGYSSALLDLTGAASELSRRRRDVRFSWLVANVTGGATASGVPGEIETRLDLFAPYDFPTLLRHIGIRGSGAQSASVAVSRESLKSEIIKGTFVHEAWLPIPILAEDDDLSKYSLANGVLSGVELPAQISIKLKGTTVDAFNRASVEVILEIVLPKT